MALLPPPKPQEVGSESSKEMIERRRKWAQAMLANAVEYRPAYSPWQAMAQALSGGLAGYFAGREDRLDKANKAKDTEFFNSWASKLNPVKSESPATEPDVTPKGIDAAKPYELGTPTTQPGKPAPFDGIDAGNVQGSFQAANFKPQASFTAQNALAESGGANVPNLAGTSSAFGPHQIVEGTWQGIVNKYPQLGLTMEDRFNPEKQDLAMREALEPEYRATLAEAGFDPGEFGNMRAMHFLNPKSAIKLLTAVKASPNAPAARFVKNDEVQANLPVFFEKGNPKGRPKTVSEVWGWLSNKPDVQPSTVGAPVDIAPPAKAEAENAPVQVADNSEMIQGAFKILGSEYASDAQKAIAGAIIQKLLIPKDPIELSPGATIFDPNTNKSIYTAPKDNSTAFQQNYASYAAQEMAEGRKPLSEFEYAKQIKAAGNPSNIPPDALIRGEHSKKKAELYTKWSQGAANSAEILRAVPLMDELVKMAPTGGLTGMFMEKFPMFKGFSNAASVLDSIIKPLAPKLRVEGSGSTSDIEYEGMLDGYARLRNTPEGNLAINMAVKNKAQIEVEVGNEIDKAAAGEQTYAEADAKIKEIRSRSILTPELKALTDKFKVKGSFDAWAAGNQEEIAPDMLPKDNPKVKIYNGRTYDQQPDGSWKGR